MALLASPGIILETDMNPEHRFFFSFRVRCKESPRLAPQNRAHSHDSADSQGGSGSPGTPSQSLGHHLVPALAEHPPVDSSRQLQGTSAADVPSSPVSTDWHHLTVGIHSEKSLVGRFRCVTIAACASTDLDGVAYDRSRLHGTA